jgi:hypothetical protein
MTGSCHCGALRVDFETQKTPADFAVRACQCTFCRRHGADSISDPQGRVTFRVADESTLVRYRFGLRTADFLICARCGCYMGAYFAEGDRAWAVVNANVMDDRAAFAPPQPFSYEGEAIEDRQTRRRARWTPAAISSS